MKRELGETKMELQDAKGKLSQADQQGVRDTPAGHKHLREAYKVLEIP